MNKRLLSLLLALLIIVGLVPNIKAASAEEINNILISDTQVTTDSHVNIEEDESKNTEESEGEEVSPEDFIIGGDFNLGEENQEEISVIDEEQEEYFSIESEYTLDYSLFNENEKKYSKINNYLEKSKLQVGDDGTLKVVLTLNNSAKIADLGVRVNNNSVTVKRNELDDNKFTIEFEIKSVTDSINIKAYVKSAFFTNKYSGDFIINGLIEQHTTYRLDADIFKEGKKEESKAKEFIEKSVLEVEDGEMKAVITFTGGSMISETIATVNGNEVAKIKNSGKDRFEMEFKITSISDDISIGVAVKAGLYNSTHNIDFVINNIIKDGTYVLEDFMTSNGSKYIKESVLEVENQKMNLAITFSMGSYMTFNTVTVNGNEVEYEVESEGEGFNSTKTIILDINSLYDEIVMGVTVNAMGHIMNHNIDFKIFEKEYSEDDDASDDTEDSTDNNSKVEVLSDGSYTIENKILKTGTTEQSYASGYIEKQGNLKVENGKYKFTLKIKDMSVLSNLAVTVDGKQVEADVVKNNDKSGTVSFNINKLSSKILIACTITVTEMNYVNNTDFNVTLDTSTLKDEQGNSVTPPNEGTIDSGSDSGNSNGTQDEEDEDEDDDEGDELEDGTYTIKNKVLKENSNSESHARDYVDKESVVTVKNGKIYLTLKFTERKMMSNISVKVEGKKVSYDTVHKTTNKLYIKFKIGSLDDEILVTTSIDTGIASLGVHDDVKFRVQLRESTLEEDDDADDYDDEDDEDTDDEDDNTVSDSENIAVDSNISNNNAQQGNLNSGNNSLYKRVTYKVNNEILTESSIGYNAARAAINKVSYYEVENDVDHYITLGLSQTNIMQNVRIFINGSQINYDVVNQDKSNNTMEIRFKVPALSTELTVKTYVTAMGTDTSFGIKFLESTLELVNTEESESQISGGSVAGTLSGDASNGNSSSILGSTLGFKTGTNNAENENYEDILVDESELEAKEYFKRYTVNNEVVSDSAMGRTMARKYLNETSIVEEIDGKLYATVTFSGSNSMENFKFEVNGQEVSHSVILNDTENELISLRFPINDINDEIKAYIYIKPMRMTISFGIKLLEDTLLLVEEGTIEKDEDIVEGVTNLSEKLSSLNNNNSNNQVNVWKIAIITAVLSTIMNFSVGGVIYLIIKKRKNKLRKVIAE